MQETQEVIKQWRSEFEAAIQPYFTLEDFNHRCGDGSYFYAHMNLAWLAFCAAKRSVVLKFPAIEMCSGAKPFYYVKTEDLIDKLESSGIRYTVES